MDGMTYEVTPIKTPKLRVGKDSKMSDKSTTKAEVKAPKRYTKTRGEHYKDIVIAVLVAGVIAFIGGMHFANKHNADLQNAVKAAQAPVAQAEVKK